MAVFSALKNKAKKSVAKKAPAKPAKKAVAKKAVAKKAPVKKAPAKKVVAKKAAAKKAPAKIELKKVLDAKDVQLISDAKAAVLRQKEVLAELESRGVTSLGRIPKKADKDLVDEARALAISVPQLRSTAQEGTWKPKSNLEEG